jgi:hypothetical protein
MCESMKRISILPILLLSAISGIPLVPHTTKAGVSVSVPGSSHPCLAGMPDGSTAGDTDTAPDQSPIFVESLTLAPRSTLTFAVTGLVGIQGGSESPPDGNAANVGYILTGLENGISTLVAPLESLVGVFLGPEQPNTTAAPPPLDFASSESRDYQSISPLLKQVFFIGDGRTSDGKTQLVIVPQGATRLYLGVMDGYGWSNNVGSFNVSISSVRTILTLETTSDLSQPWLSAPLEASMITSEGKLDVGFPNNAQFYRLKIESSVE